MRFELQTANHVLVHGNCYWCKERSQSWDLSLMNITCIFHHGQYLGVHSVCFFLCLLPWTQVVKNPPAMQETWVWSLGQEDPQEKGMAPHCNILAWRNPRTEEPVHGVTHSRTRLRYFHFLCFLDIRQHPSPPLPAFFLPQIFVECLPPD